MPPVTAAPAVSALAEVVVTLGGTILDVRHVGPGAGSGGGWSPWLSAFVVGEGPAAHLPAAIPGHDGAGVPLVASVGGGICVRLVPGMTGTIERAGAEQTVAALVAGGATTLTLAVGERASVLVGPTLVTIRVEACTPVPRYRAQIDRPLWLSQGGALALLAVLMIVVQRAPPASAPRFDDPDVQARVIQYLRPAAAAARAEPEPAPAPRPAQARHAEPVRDVGEPVDVVEPEDTTAPEVPRVGAIAAIAAGLRGQVPSDMAKRSGVFGLAGFMRALEEAAGDADASRARYAAFSGDDSAFAAAAAAAAPTELTGLGLAGTGRQGGGLAERVVDFDFAWLFPKGGLRSMSAERMRARAGKERFAAREVSAAAPERRQSVTWTASVGRDLIRGVVNRNKPAVRRCFADGLVKNPGLAGEVEVAFTIQSDGAVAYADVARSTVADAEVEACVKQAVERWRFPVFVASGGDVDVRFPFTVGRA